jgi:hypothetical protein
MLSVRDEDDAKVTGGKAGYKPPRKCGLKELNCGKLGAESTSQMH